MAMGDKSTARSATEFDTFSADFDIPGGSRKGIIVKATGNSSTLVCRMRDMAADISLEMRTGTLFFPIDIISVTATGTSAIGYLLALHD